MRLPRPITEGARAVQGIPDALVAEAPTFTAEVWPTLWSLLAGKTVVAYNASFEVARLYTSAAPYSASYAASRTCGGSARWKRSR